MASCHGQGRDSQWRCFLPPKTELQERTSLSCRARRAAEMAQLHKQPEKFSCPLGLPSPKRCFFPSSALPTISLSGQLTALILTTDISRWLLCQWLLRLNLCRLPLGCKSTSLVITTIQMFWCACARIPIFPHTASYQP